jgi:hypothetical protein
MIPIFNRDDLLSKRLRCYDSADEINFSIITLLFHFLILFSFSLASLRLSKVSYQTIRQSPVWPVKPAWFHNKTASSSIIPVHEHLCIRILLGLVATRYHTINVKCSVDSCSDRQHSVSWIHRRRWSHGRLGNFRSMRNHVHIIEAWNVHGFSYFCWSSKAWPVSLSFLCNCWFVTSFLYFYFWLWHACGIVCGVVQSY